MLSPFAAMSLASSELKSFEKMELTKGSKKDQLRSTSAKKHTKRAKVTTKREE